MAEKHPYVTAPGYLAQVLTQFKKSFPQSVTAETLKKLGLARNNESYVINILRYLGLIDQDGGKTAEAARIFSLHDKNTFANEFGKKVTESYSNLFELYGEGVWDLGVDSLMTFFRSSDDTTDRVARLQTSTFRVLTSFAGHGEEVEKPSVKQGATTPKAKATRRRPVSLPVGNDSKASEIAESEKRRDIGLTVRIEINLPADGTQETYDRIFTSIRENLLNA